MLAGQEYLAQQGRIGPRHLPVLGCRRDLHAHAREHLIDLDAGRAHVLDEGRGERTVSARAVERGLPRRGGKSDERPGPERRVAGKAGRNRGGPRRAELAGEAAGERIIAASIKYDDVRTRLVVEP